MSQDSASRANKTNTPSLGIVQEVSTQFDEPFYRYLASHARLQLSVYYYGDNSTDIRKDPEIGRQVGWGAVAHRGYDVFFASKIGPLKFARMVSRNNHDLVILSGYNKPHTVCTALMARLRGVPTGLRSDNVLPEDGGRSRHWIAKCCVYPLLFKLYTTGHPVGRSAGQYLARFGFKAESQFRFPYGIDNRWFAVESAKNRMDGPANRASWGLPLHGPVVCGVMKFSDREDPLTLVRAFKQAKKTLPSLNLLLIGDGPLRGLVEKEAGSYLKESIVLSGYQKYDMLPSAYAATDLFVHTASGAWEVSVNEALACGLPVVASDAVGSAEELVLDNRLGATFRHGDADDLSEKIASALTDQALLNRARSIGFACLAEWDYPATAERLVSALNYARGKRRFSRIADQSA